MLKVIMVKRWKCDVKHLSMIANVEQQAAFSALTKSAMCKDSGIFSNVLFQSVMVSFLRTIAEMFLPAVLGCEISSIEQNLFLFLARMVCLGVTNLAEKNSISTEATDVIVQARVNLKLKRGN